MKKILLFASIAALLATACSVVPEIEVNEPDSPTYTFTLNATMDSELTKTAYENDKTFSWSAGDQISVLFHNGDVNKFFTLTNTTGAGTSATFSGEIESGYAIGASDDASKKYALFPAGSHSYTAGNLPVFNIPASTDFTASHFSANIPMAANGDGENSFVFKHMAGVYKVTFTGIDESVTKVRLAVTNQLNYQISGDFQLKASYDAQHLFRWSQNGTSNIDKRSLAYIENVVDNKAVFYIPYSHDTYGEYSDFVPTFVLTNATNGNTLITASAKDKASFIGSSFERKSDYNRMVVMPSIPAPGLGTPPGWRSNHGINWDLVDTSVGGRTSENLAGINTMKVTADSRNIYILLDIKSSYLVDNAEYDYSNYITIYAGDGSDTGKEEWMWTTKRQNYFTGWMKTANNAVFSKVDGSIIDAIANIDGEHAYYEIAIARTGNSALLGTTTYIGCVFNKCYYDEGEVHNDPSQGNTWVGYAPTPWTPMFEVSLPTYSNPATTESPIELTFTEASGEVLNPERGFYQQQSFHFKDSEIPSASLWSNPEPLVLPLFYFEDFRTSDLSDDVLNRIRDIFDNIRAAGKKAIVRFGYINAHGEGDKPWDAGITQIRSHINQVKPILQANEDIIYVMQAGFVGVYGEWYYVSNDFNFSLDGSSVVNYTNRAQVITDLLAAVPHRQVSLRSPNYKRYYLYPSSINTWDEINSWGTSDNQRLGFFNDGFRGSADDIGTFDDDNDRNMWYSQGNWLICGGEAAYRGGDTQDEKSAWLTANSALANPDNAIAALKQQHFSYLNSNKNNILMDYWDGDTQGVVSCGTDRITDFRKALGYRLVLNSADFTYSSLTSGSTVNYSISIQNKGCAPVMYARQLKLVVIHEGTATVVANNLMDVRNLAPGAAEPTVLNGSFSLPYSLSVGDQLAIWLPDADILDKGLDEIPAYSIRLANSDVTWSNGYNVLYTF